MQAFLLSNEALIRLIAFCALFAAMAGWELAAPRRPQAIARRARWPANLGIVLLNSALVRLVLPAGAVGFAAWMQLQGWGLFNALQASPWIAVPAGVVLLDLAIYLQHVLFHAVPPLWRLHRMHHADTEFDVTTGARFHPLEILLSLAIKLAVIAALGPPAIAVLAFELLLNMTAMFNHANVRMPRRLDALLRLLVVTPDMHRVHHSVLAEETDSNFGFNLPWWDRLFGTYRAQPREGHFAMRIGLAKFRDPVEQRLGRMLAQPLR